MATISAQASSSFSLRAEAVGRLPTSSFLGEQVAIKIASAGKSRQLQLKAVAAGPDIITLYSDAIKRDRGVFGFPLTRRQPLAPGAVRDSLPNDSLVLQWNFALLKAVRDVFSKGDPNLPGPPVAARSFGIVNSCMYEAWAAYDDKAVGAFFNMRQKDRSEAKKAKAISAAAALAITSIFPNARVRPLQDMLATVGLDFSIIQETPPTKPTGVDIAPEQLGLQAATSVLQAFITDGCNFPTYNDTTNYKTSQTETEITDPNRWTTVSSFVELGGRVRQANFLLPHWGLANKRAFALSRPDEFRPDAPWDPVLNTDEFNQQMDEILEFSKTIGEGGPEGDRLRAVAEYWADGPNHETAPGIHILQAAFVSRRDKHDLDKDIKLFTRLGGTLQDCAIAAWDTKRAYDNARMITPIRILRGNAEIEAWGGPGKGLKKIRGFEWRPYLPTPPFPDHISGHSTFAGGASYVLKRFTGSDKYGESFLFRKGTSQVEPGFPENDVELKWETFLEAETENGISRLYGGIHWDKANKDGRATGAKVAQKAFDRVTKLLGQLDGPIQKNR